MTIHRRVNSLSTAVIQKQRYLDNKAAEPIFGNFPKVDYPLDVVQIDHTLVDIIIVDQVERLPIGRPYLTIAIDVYSRCIAGFILSLEAPSSVSVGLLSFSEDDGSGKLMISRIDIDCWTMFLPEVGGSSEQLYRTRLQ